MSLTKGVELLRRRVLAFASAAGVLAAAAGADPLANEVGELPEMLAEEETPAASASPEHAVEAASDERQGFPFRVSVFCTESWDAPASPLNTVLLVDASPVGGGIQVLTGIGWDVILRTVNPASWLSQIAVRVSDSLGMGGVVLRPGAGDNFAGGPTRYNSGGIIKFADIAVPNIVLMPDNLIRFEFFETFDDHQGVIDGRWVCGHLTVSMLHPAAQPGSPGGQFFSTEASFATAVGGLSNLAIEDFESTPAGVLASAAITTTGGVTVTPSVGCPVGTRIGVYTVNIAGAHPVDGDKYLLVAANPTNATCPTGHSSILTIDLPAPSTAFGVHITDWGDFLPGATLTLTTPTGINHPVAITPPALANGNAMFIGVVGASVPFTRVILTSTAIGESFGIDRILFGDPDCSVSSPPCRPAGVPNACPGDANGDGTVTFADVSAILEHWGAAYALDDAATPGDANGDGVVNFSDVSSVLENWGVECLSR